jgi:hypothetical protein
MKTIFCSLLIASCIVSQISNLYAQNNVGIGTLMPNTKALLDLTANDKGILVPRVTTAQRIAINPTGNADAALLVYDTNDNLFYFWNSTQWIPFPQQAGSNNISLNFDANTGTLSLTDNGGTLTTNIPPDSDSDPNNELITNVVFNANGNILTINEGGNTWSTAISIVDPDSDPTNEIQQLTLNNNILNLSLSNNNVDLSSFAGDWKLLGNAGTNPATNFLGTTDNQDLVLRTNNTERVRVTNNGNVGVGGFPNAKFDVSNGSDGLAIGQIHGDNTHTIQTYIDGQWANRTTYAGGCCNKLLLQPDAGEVAIGGSLNPTAKLEINLVNPNGWGGNTKATRIFSPDNGFFLDLNTYVIGGGNIGYHFSPNNNTGLSIATNGNVGIGTTDPSEKLQINSSLNSTFIRMDDGGRNFDIRFGDSFQGHFNPTGVVYYEVNGNETHMFGGDVYPDNNAGRNLGASSYRWGTVFANNGTINTSDLRLKKDIQPTSYGLKEVVQMRPVSYLWKDIEGGKKLGFIAQELQQLVPEVVSVGNDENKTLGVFYSDLIPVLTKAIQEQQQQIESLKTKNAYLENKTVEIESLKAKLEKLESYIYSETKK